MNRRVSAEAVSRSYPRRGSARASPLIALDAVSISVASGERVGLVGESGSGKSTLGRLLLGLERPDVGTVRFDGVDITTLGRAGLRDFRRSVQVVFQDPYASLNPRLMVGRALREALTVNEVASGRDAEERAVQLLERVGLEPDAAGRFPHEFSGGQRQRIGIARALSVGPSILIADEPVSALDVSVQAKVLVLLADLQRDLGLGYLFVSHDLAVVRQMCERIVVLRAGKVVETGGADRVFEAPESDYTRALLAAVPRLPGRV